MGKFIGLIAAFVVIVSTSAVVHANAGGNQVFNGELPWPFGTEIPFPWEDIDGIWMGQESGGELVTYFSLRVCGQTRDERTLEVFELAEGDVIGTFSVLARGQGVESQKIVRGQMVDLRGYGRYQFSIRAFGDDSDELHEKSIARVMSVAPVDPTDPRNVSFVLHRVSELPLEVVSDKNLPLLGNCGSTKR